MGKAKNIYTSTYSTTLLIVLVYFAHNILESVHYDVLNINHTFRLGAYSFFIKDIFPFYDAPDAGYYGEVPRMDIQNYIFKLSGKVILVAYSVDRLRLLKTANLLLREIPGREFRRMPYIQMVLVGLFSYNLLDFMFFAGQSNWIAEAFGVFFAIFLICIIKRDKDA